MSRWNVIIAPTAGFEPMAQTVIERFNRAWTASTPVAFEVAPAAALAADAPSNPDAVVLLADRTATSSVILELLHGFEERCIPVMALLDALPEPGNCFEFGGALTASRAATDAQLCGMLHGALHRQREVRQLRAEVALHNRLDGGLKGQMAKMHEELQLAAVVQREFLPREAPTMHGVELASLWRPSNYVSGDIYDLARLDEDHVGIFIADAVGHGVPAALMTMVICRSLVTKEIAGSQYRLVPPCEVLARLNTEMIRRQGRTTRFTTAAYALVDCRNRMMTLAGAGHPPPVRLSADGVSQALETTGGLLGVFPDEQYQQIEVELALDDRILFYTDGFEQAFPQAESDAYSRRLPSTRYRSEFAELGRLSTAAEMIEAISQRLDDQAGSLHQIDDLTLICMRAGSLVLGESAANSDRRRMPRIAETELRLAS